MFIIWCFSEPGSLEELEVTHLEEIVHSLAEDPSDTLYDLESDEEDSETPQAETLLVQDADEVLNDSGAIAYESCLRTLANLRIPQHCTSQNCDSDVNLQSVRIGTAMHLTWVCLCQLLLWMLLMNFTLISLLLLSWLTSVLTIAKIYPIMVMTAFCLLEVGSQKCIYHCL